MKNILILIPILILLSCSDPCSNGTQDNGETGQDCGGPCIACASNLSTPNGNQTNSVFYFNYNGDSIFADITSATIYNQQITVTGVNSKATSNTDDDESITIFMNNFLDSLGLYNMPSLDSSISSPDSRHFGLTIGVGNGNTVGYTTLNNDNQNAYVEIDTIDDASNIIKGTFEGRVYKDSNFIDLTNGYFYIEDLVH